MRPSIRNHIHIITIPVSQLSSQPEAYDGLSEKQGNAQRHIRTGSMYCTCLAKDSPSDSCKWPKTGRHTGESPGKGCTYINISTKPKEPTNHLRQRSPLPFARRSSRLSIELFTFIDCLHNRKIKAVPLFAPGPTRCEQFLLPLQPSSLVLISGGMGWYKRVS